LLTNRSPRAANTGGMDEPTHLHESQFWDQVADWLLGSRALGDRVLTADEIEALLRALQDGPQPD